MAGLAGESDRFIGALTTSLVIGHYPIAKCSDMTRRVFAFAKFGKERCAYVGQIYHVLQKPESAANLPDTDRLQSPARHQIQRRTPFPHQVQIDRQPVVYGKEDKRSQN